MESVDYDVADGMRVWAGDGRKREVLIELEGLLNDTSSCYQCLEKGTRNVDNIQPPCLKAINYLLW